MREFCQNLSAKTFLTDPTYGKTNIWDLKYISTSDEEDNDSEDTSEEEEEEVEGEEKEKEEKKEGEDYSTKIDDRDILDQKLKEASLDDLIKQKDNDNGLTPEHKIWKNESPGKNENVPLLAKKLRPAKKK